MDHTRLLNKIRDRENIINAYSYALNERINCDHYFDYFEIEYVRHNRDTVINEIVEELKTPDNYMPRLAYAYYPPKSKLCYRRMIYISFKDLVIRYAFLIVLANSLDDELSQNCFANRRAKDKHAKNYFLENFASHSWPKFCQWQKKGIEKHSVLVRTDISSFYDSISHEYLANIIAEELSINIDTILMRLFKKLLTFPVISYSQLTKIVQDPEEYKQGLPIGNNTEGFLANVYLKKIDETMQNCGVEFGRYNDDMRIFADKRKDAMEAILILQQSLLSKGLNLNASKTEIAESKEKMEGLRSKDYEAYDYQSADDEESENEEENFINKIDLNFDEFERVFEKEDILDCDKDAKEYCKFISCRKSKNEKFLDLSERKPEHIEKLGEILVKWQGSSRHASWLIIQSAFYEKVTVKTKEMAKNILFVSLQSDEVNTYAKYRLLHHLVKLRKSQKGKEFKYLAFLTKSDKENLQKILIKLLQCPAFELNVISLWLLKVLGGSAQDLKNYVRNFIPKPVGEPIKNALFYISNLTFESKPIDIAMTDEPDDVVASY